MFGPCEAGPQRILSILVLRLWLLDVCVHESHSTGATGFLGSHSHRIDLAEVLLLLFLGLSVLVWLVVGGRKLGHLLDLFGHTLYHEAIHVILTWLELAVGTVHNDKLTDSIVRSYIHRRLHLVVFQTGSCAVLNKQGNDTLDTLHGCEVQRSSAILINAVDVCTEGQKLLDHAALTHTLVEDSVVEWGPTRVVRHVHKVCRVTTQDCEDLKS